ncbi:MAG TPA: PAS domain-containing sensor histidine kinase [Candidatus Aminicenantes bacterium]|mgnify:CR=1 FL=1|nr:PAS domain-containing sensor histidine kinase [Candidatus Aminicenantes bacterium]
MAKKKPVHNKDGPHQSTLTGSLRSLPGFELERAQLFLNMAGVMILALDNSGRVAMINRRGCEILGGQAEEIRGLDWFGHFIPEPRRAQVRNVFQDIVQEKKKSREYQEGPVLTLRGEQKLIAWHNAVIRDDHGQIIGTLSSGEDISEIRRAEDELKESRQLYQAFINANRDMIFVKDEQFRYVVVNDAMVAFFKRSREDVLTRTDFELMEVSAAEKRRESDLRTLNTHSVGVTEENIGHRVFETTKFPILLKGDRMGVGGIIRDITERRHGEEEREYLREQMAQAQKMESMGRLAGGVAHDFNNILSVIKQHAETAMEKVDPADDLHMELKEIRRAARRSADLTRQLMTFTRKQTAMPRRLNLNDTIAGMVRMLKHLIGEHVQLSWQPGEHVWPVHIDPTQVDQILANLCINARDAISGKGRVTIETKNLTVENEQLNLHAGFLPGEYIRLSISDNGCGMDRETLANVFDPFFTTKETNMAPGLGLSAVYGIVKQNGGFLHAYSEPGRGSTFHIYLPRHIERPSIAGPDPEPSAPRQRKETILLVEDEPPILKLGQRMLQELGYHVLTADSADEAIEVSCGFSGGIDLLIIDVIMSGMNGCELAAELARNRPDSKIMFMSGYSEEIIDKQISLKNKTLFIQKPFTIRELAAKVQTALKTKEPRS